MDDLATALRAWESLVGDAEPRPLPRVTNAVWQVGEKYVLKQLPEFTPGVGPVDTFRVLTYLQASGVPVALPIVTDDAQIHTLVGDRLYTLLPRVPNEPADHGHAATTAHAVGAAVARLDQALARYPLTIPSYIDDPAPQILGESLPKLPADLRQVVAPFVDRLWATVSGLPIQRTHGDCNTGNVLVFDNAVSAFIDLDHLPIGPRVRDLSYYLASRLRSGARDTTVAVLGDYVAGYQATYPLTEQELAAVVPLVLLVEIGIASWWTYGWTPSPEGYRQSALTVTWICEHFDELIAAAGTPSR